MDVESGLVIKSLSNQLSEANMKIAVLEARIMQMERDAATTPPQDFGDNTPL